MHSYDNSRRGFKVRCLKFFLLPPHPTRVLPNNTRSRIYIDPENDIMEENRIPDPRIYWESEIKRGRYFYHDLETGAIVKDAVTFVPPQTAPTPANLMDAYFASMAAQPPLPASATQSMAPSQPLPFVMASAQTVPLHGPPLTLVSYKLL
ncbi:hypothetical protein MVEN_00091800 [Mycena venus]|uniref:Uncharacterized protein n=1 Tax=Mycena venus TaxID=2733690 RepID=A0A8H6Z8M2_9AGAR|nr:hypothetical protein MVEN_00091800 [Mycena venus]